MIRGRLIGYPMSRGRSIGLGGYPMIHGRVNRAGFSPMPGSSCESGLMYQSWCGPKGDGDLRHKSP